MRCTTCQAALGEVSCSAPAGNKTGSDGNATVKLSKYLIHPLCGDNSTSQRDTWISTLLCSLKYSAASHGARRFLLHPTSSSESMEVWLFSRARFTTSLVHFRCSPSTGDICKGYRIFYRPPCNDQAESESVEAVELRDPIFSWTSDALTQCSEALPAELRNVLPGWQGAYLATYVQGQE